MKPGLAFAAGLVAACAGPIPPAARYPAGTAFVAHYLRPLGTNVRYIDAGRGTPVIFVHGFGASMYAWRKNLAPVESAGFRVLAFDNRGFGSSDKPAHGYSNADYVALLVAFMDSLQLPDAVLIGHSMGGAIAAEFAIAYPKRVRGLVLVDAAGLGVREPFLLRMAGWPGIGRLVSGLRTRWITGRILKSTYADPRKVQPQDVDQYYAPLAEPDFGRALRGVLREFRFAALSGRLAGIDAPTLVLWGRQDRWIPPSVGMAFATELPRVAYISVPHAGHALPEEAPDEVNRLVIAFLKEGVPHPPDNLASALHVLPSAGR
jgi:pimeloyl-ACP methyl ester carboxylesterase